MKLTHVIYKLTFPNGKVYIGQTCNFKKRMNCHKAYSRMSPDKCKHYNYIINKAIRKYGWENVQKEIMKRCKISRADFWEKKFIKEFKSTDFKFGYNLDSGGNKNKTLSQEAKNKISKANSGRVFSSESKKKLSDSSWTKGKFGEDNHSSVPVLQYDLEGNLVKRWGGLLEVYRVLGFHHSSIGLACRGSSKTAYNFIWVYEKDFSKKLLQTKLDNAHNKLTSPVPKPVLQIDISTNAIIKEWSSGREVERVLGIRQDRISKACNNKLVQVNNFKWRFKN